MTLCPSHPRSALLCPLSRQAHSAQVSISWSWDNTVGPPSWCLMLSVTRPCWCVLRLAPPTGASSLWRVPRHVGPLHQCGGTLVAFRGGPRFFPGRARVLCHYCYPWGDLKLP